VEILYKICYAGGLITAVLFATIVLLTGKGDAMSGGSGVRTTFKGKANFDDIMSRWTLIFGAALFGFVLVVDILVGYMHTT
jgi:preprotein translocase subunit SecG